MRFHVGLSFRSKLKTLITLLLGIAIMFICTIVNAETFNDAPNMYYYRDNATSEIFPNVLTSNSDYYYYPTNSGFNAYNFTTIYYFNQTASNVICPSGFADVSTRVSLLDTTGNYINDGLNFTAVNNGTIRLASIQNGYADVTFENVDLTKNLKFVTNASYGRQTQVGIFAVHRPLTITCKTADWQYIVNNNNENTQNIINNNNENTQEIVDAIDNMNDTNEEINDFLQDDTPPTFDNSQITTITGLLPAGPVDSLLNIPFKFLTKIVNSLSNHTCSPFTFTFVFNEQMSFPCFSTLYSRVDNTSKIYLEYIPSGLLLIYYFKHLYKKVDRATAMKTNTNDEWGVL